MHRAREEHHVIIARMAWIPRHVLIRITKESTLLSFFASVVGQLGRMEEPPSRLGDTLVYSGDGGEFFE